MAKEVRAPQGHGPAQDVVAASVPSAEAQKLPICPMGPLRGGPRRAPLNRCGRSGQSLGHRGPGEKKEMRDRTSRESRKAKERPPDRRDDKKDPAKE